MASVAMVIRDFAKICESGGEVSLEIHIEGLIWTKSRRFRESSGPVFAYSALMRCPLTSC